MTRRRSVPPLWLEHNLGLQRGASSPLPRLRSPVCLWSRALLAAHLCALHQVKLDVVLHLIVAVVVAGLLQDKPVGAAPRRAARPSQTETSTPSEGRFKAAHGC